MSVKCDRNLSEGDVCLASMEHTARLAGLCGKVFQSRFVSEFEEIISSQLWDWTEMPENISSAEGTLRNLPFSNIKQKITYKMFLWLIWELGPVHSMVAQMCWRRTRILHLTS